MWDCLIGRVLIWDHETLTTEQRTWIKGASADWGSDRLIKVNQVVPTPAGRAVVVWLDAAHASGLERQGLSTGQWTHRLGKIEVDQVVVGPEDDGLDLFDRAGLGLMPDLQPTPLSVLRI